VSTIKSVLIGRDPITIMWGFGNLRLDLLQALTLDVAVAYCGACKTHYGEKGFGRLPLVGIMSCGTVELRNCVCKPEGQRFTIGREIAFDDPCPSTERAVEKSDAPSP